LVISKSDPAQQIVIETEDGQALTATSAALSTGVSPQIRRAGGGNSAEEVWVFDQPQAGNWRLRVDGAGLITIWQDYKSLPATAPPPSPTPLPTSQPTSISVIELFATQPLTATPTATLPPTTETPVLSAAEVAVIPFITPPAPISPPLPEPTPFNWTLLILIGLFLAIAFTVFGLWLHHTRRPHVSGTMRVLSGGQLVRTIDLDSLGKTAVSLGKSPADIPLAGAAATVTIVPGAQLEDDTRQMFVRSDDAITINGQPTLPSVLLTDAAHIDLGGGIQLWYENLRLRRAGRLSAQDVNRKKVGAIKS
jgi:hypothetical protein